jgi:hypothetical protein
MQKKNDRFLEGALESAFLSFKANKRIFRGILVLSRLPNYTPVSNFLDKRLPYEIPVQDIYTFQKESLKRMFDLLNDGKKSGVLKKNPLMRKQRSAA